MSISEERAIAQQYIGALPMVHGDMGAWRLPAVVGAMAAGTYRPDSLVARLHYCHRHHVRLLSTHTRSTTR